MKNLFLVDNNDLLDESIEIIKYNIDIIDAGRLYFGYEKEREYHEIRQEILERMSKGE